MAISESTFHAPSRNEFKAALTAYEKKESRGPVYFEALGKLREAWGRAEPMADAIWLLLKSWHRQFYRYGPLDLNVLATASEIISMIWTGSGRAIFKSFARQKSQLWRHCLERSQLPPEESIGVGFGRARLPRRRHSISCPRVSFHFGTIPLRRNTDTC